jgi:hypothetical protein
MSVINLLIICHKFIYQCSTKPSDALLHVTLISVACRNRNLDVIPVIGVTFIIGVMFVIDHRFIDAITNVS